MKCLLGRIKLGQNAKIHLWSRAGGACAFCGEDLLEDIRTHRRVRWGELAHIIGARPDAARGDVALSRVHETDPDNILLLCPSCHTKVDRDADAYTVDMLQQRKLWHEERVRAAASKPASAQALPIVLTNVIAGTPNSINDDVIAEALLQEGLVRGRDSTMRIGPIDPATYGGRVETYWEQNVRELRHELADRLEGRAANQGPLDKVAFFGRADMPSLMAAGMILGNRCQLHIFQPRRSDGRWLWPDPDAAPPRFHWNDPAKLQGSGPLALVLSLSVRVPHEDVRAAFPSDVSPRIVEFTVEEPDFELVKGPRTGVAFHEEVRRCVGVLEQHLGSEKILHVFPAMPASLATHFGCSMTLNYIPKLQIYDRDAERHFFKAMTLPDAVASS